MWVQILLIFIQHYSQMCPLYIPDPRFEHRPLDYSDHKTQIKGKHLYGRDNPISQNTNHSTW